MAENKLNYLSQKYDMYITKAKEYEKVNDFSMAKRNYFLAAETLMEMAKDSSPNLKKARLDNAAKLVAKANNLKATKKPAKSTSTDKPDDAGDASSEDSEDGGKAWQSAEIPNVHFEDIVGLEDVKKAIRVRMIYPIKHPEIYKLYNKTSGGGLLMYGPPGTGKTMIAKAIACEVGAKFYAIKGSDLRSKWVGESEKNISSLFETARNDKLAIIMIDEIDTILGQRGEDKHNDKVVNEFLQQIDGFMGRAENLLLLAATNRPWDIDSAAMRSGRFSEKIYVPLPDKVARKFLFEKNLKDVPIDSSVDLDYLADVTVGYSGADIAEICDKAKIEPLLKSITLQEEGKFDENNIIKLSKTDLVNAIKTVRKASNKEEIKKFEDFAKSFGENIKLEKFEEDINPDD
ncbi:MAG: ATP-binding protein [Clostridia bacterium]|nr:ATP-binding protein [Clostridia bacterium]